MSVQFAVMFTLLSGMKKVVDDEVESANAKPEVVVVQFENCFPVGGVAVIVTVVPASALIALSPLTVAIPFVIEIVLFIGVNVALTVTALIGIVKEPSVTVTAVPSASVTAHA